MVYAYCTYGYLRLSTLIYAFPRGGPNRLMAEKCIKEWWVGIFSTLLECGGAWILLHTELPSPSQRLPKGRPLGPPRKLAEGQPLGSPGPIKGVEPENEL